MADLKIPGVLRGGGGAQAGTGSCKWSAAAKPVRRASPSPLRPARGRGACARPGSPGPRAPPFSRPALPPRLPTLSTQRRLAWMAWPAQGGKGKLGTHTSKRPARPAEPQAGGEQHEAAGPGPPHPGRAELYLRGPVPAECPTAWRGAAPPSQAARRGGALFATCSCCTRSALVRPQGELTKG